MTTPTDCSDPTAAISEPPPSDFEAGLLRILAYLSEKPYRRWIAYALIFSIIYAALATVLSYSFTFLFIRHKLSQHGGSAGILWVCL